MRHLFVFIAAAAALVAAACNSTEVRAHASGAAGIASDS